MTGAIQRVGRTLYASNRRDDVIVDRRADVILTTTCAAQVQHKEEMKEEKELKKMEKEEEKEAKEAEKEHKVEVKEEVGTCCALRWKI